MMKLIVGLGNLGEKYENSRHNVGFRVVDALQSKLKSKSKNFIVKKTNVFMNESGKAIKHIISQYPNISISNLYIIHDDLDIPLGQFKIQFRKGPKDHKGVQSVEEALGTNDFWRVRVGVENRDSESRISGEDYVLQEFTERERKIINRVVGEVAQALIRHAEQN